MGQSSVRLHIPLNIQRFAMSLGSNAWENQNQGNNSSSIGWSLSVTTTGGTYDNTGRSYYRVYTDNYDTGNVGFNISKTTTLNFSGTTQDYGHADDGSLGSKVIHFILHDNVNNKTYTNDITVNFTTYPRYANITSLTASGISETAIRVNFSVDATIDYCQYSLNSQWWADTGVSADSRSFDIGGLSAGQPHSVRIRVKRADSQQWTDSTITAYASTYDYPHITSTPDFTIGNAMYMDLYNPLGRNCTCTMYGNDNSVIWSTSGWTGNRVGSNNTPQDIENLYKSIPNNTSGTYKMRVVYSVSTRDVTGGTYSVNTETSRPTFNLFEYEDINPTTLALTGDSSVCILNYSTIQATISTSNKASVNNWAGSITSYKLEISGNEPQTSPEVEGEDVTIQIANAKSSTYEVSAIDSRKIPKKVTLVGDNISYTPIIKNNTSSLERQTGVSEETILTLKGTIWKGNFGQVNNSIKSVTYSYKSSTDSDYTPGVTTITPTVDNDGNFTFTGQIRGDTDDGFDIDKSYSVIVEVTDELSIAQYTFVLVSGTPHVAYAESGVSIMGKYNDTIGGTIQRAGDCLFPVGYIYTSGSSTNPSTYFGGTWVEVEDPQLVAWGVYASGSLLSSHNIQSVTQTGTGTYVITFANAMEDTNYIPLASVEVTGSAGQEIIGIYEKTTTLFHLDVCNYAGTAVDAAEINFAVWGTLTTKEKYIWKRTA